MDRDIIRLGKEQKEENWSEEKNILDAEKDVKPTNVKSTNIGEEIGKLKMFKQLVICNMMGVYIEEQDGHRWIRYNENDLSNFIKDLEKQGISINSKVYGGFREALGIINYAFKKMYNISLEDFYNKRVNERYDIFNVDSIIVDRVDKVKKEKGGIY